MAFEVQTNVAKVHAALGAKIYRSQVAGPTHITNISSPSPLNAAARPGFHADHAIGTPGKSTSTSKMNEMPAINITTLAHVCLDLSLNPVNACAMANPSTLKRP